MDAGAPQLHRRAQTQYPDKSPHVELHRQGISPPVARLAWHNLVFTRPLMEAWILPEASSTSPPAPACKIITICPSGNAHITGQQIRSFIA